MRNPTEPARRTAELDGLTDAAPASACASELQGIPFQSACGQARAVSDATPVAARPAAFGERSSDASSCTPLPLALRIAALIPAFNEEPVLEGTVVALLAAGCALDDIYVVDDRSTDRTAEIASGLGVHVYTVPKNGGKARAQVAALEHFALLENYGWVLFLDGDTKVDRLFVSEMRKVVASDGPKAALYVGQVRSVRNTHLYSALRAMEYAIGHDLFKQGQSNCNVILVSPGCASMYSSSVLHELHIDHSTLAEDMDLTIQTHRKGMPICYVPSAIVHTQDPSTFRDYYKQILRWYRGFWQVVKKHQFFSWGAGKKKRPIDFYVLFLILDAVVFNKGFMIIAAALASPWLLPYLLCGDVMVAFCIAVYAAWRTRRLDVIYKFPIYYWMFAVTFFAFMSAMLDIIVLGKTKLNWNKVKRYDFASHLPRAADAD
jgi:cellulose synthase/poly-beta-1,6-N-acetylglucosamine synthase-like glycosyltransferase